MNKWVKGNRIYLGILAVLFGVVVFLETNAPQPLDWGLYFSKNAQTPYGTYLLYENLPVLFPQRKIRSVRSRIRTVLKRDDSRINNYIFVNEFFEPDTVDAMQLIDFIENGGNVFIAANRFDGYFGGYFDLATENNNDDFDYDFSGEEKVENETKGSYQSGYLNFEHPELRSDSDYAYKNNFSNYYLTNYGGGGVSVLGRDEFDNVNFIHIKAGSGSLFINSTPRAFSNYFIAHERNHEYVFKALSYLPIDGVYWDEYYKDDRSPSASPLRFIMDQEALRWGFLTLMGTVLVFMIFSAKRKQRVIPVIKPLENTTVEFVDIISRLYYQRLDHNNIAQKKITYFLEHVRSKYQVATHVFDEAFMKRVANRSNIPIEQVNELFNYIHMMRSRGGATAEDLFDLDRRIQEFVKASQR